VMTTAEEVVRYAKERGVPNMDSFSVAFTLQVVGSKSAPSGCPFAGKTNSESAASGCPFAEIVKATAPAVAPHVPAIVNDFYPRMFKNNPEAKAFFNPANQFADPPLQRQALANAILAYATNIDDLTPLAEPVEIIANKHCGLGVLPEHYPIVHDNLLKSIAHILGPKVVTPEIGKGWSEAVLALADILAKREEELYKAAEARDGGWRGVKKFKILRKRAVSTRSIEFTFEAVDNPEPIGFSPGQFLTIHIGIEGATPRHYTVTSKPGDAFLQCCVALEDKGFVSKALHGMDEGTVVGLAAPFGLFRIKDKPAVLVSAGIGVTPMKSFLTAHPDKIRMALHVERNKEAHAFRDYFLKSGVECQFIYTEGRTPRHPTPAELMEILGPHVKDCDFYLCGPPPFVNGTKDALTAAGAEGVYRDVFGPDLAGLM